MDDNQENKTDEVLETEEVTLEVNEAKYQTVPGETDDTTDSDIIPSDVNVMLSLEEMIKTNITTIDNLRVEIKKMQEMFVDSFVNNPTYIENDKKAKEALKAKSTTRQEIAKQPAVMQLSAKVKEMRTDMKERQNSLSDYLLEYQRLTGATQIEDNDGQIRDISNTAKLIKRSEPKRGKK